MNNTQNAEKPEVLDLDNSFKIKKYINQTVNQAVNATAAMSEKMAKTAANEVVAELKKNKFMKESVVSPFQKTESVLYNYNNFKNAIEDKMKQIEFIGEIGLQRTSKSITSFGTPGASIHVDTEVEKAEDKIQALAASIVLTNKFIEIIDAALDKIRNDDYFQIIELKYFQGKTREFMAEYFEVDVSTITRNKNRLINTLKIYLFSDDVVREIFS